MYHYSPYYDFGNGYGYVPDAMTMEFISAILFWFFIFFVAVLVFAASYVLSSIGLYTLAKHRGMKNAFLAFVPFSKNYLLGLIHDDINKTMNKTTKNASKLLIINIIAACVCCLSFPFVVVLWFISGVPGTAIALTVFASLLSAVAFVFVISFLVYRCVCAYGIFKEYAYDKATLFLIFSIAFVPLMSLFLFIIRKKQSGYELWQKQREQQQVVVKFEEEVTETAVEEAFEEQSIEQDADQTVIDDDFIEPEQNN